jgi:hypothetical protein
MERFLALTPEERLRFGRAGREKVRAQFDERIIIRKYLDEIRRVEKDTPESDVATPGR